MFCLTFNMVFKKACANISFLYKMKYIKFDFDVGFNLIVYKHIIIT